MKTPHRIIVLVLLASFICSPILAQDQPLMTERELSRFISDWPDVLKWCEARGKEYDAASGTATVRALLTGADLEAYLKSKGWSLERFSYVAGATFTCVLYITFERENPDVLKEFDDAIAEVRASTEISAEDKAEMIKGLEEARKSMLHLADEANIKEAELRLVRARYDDLSKLLEDSE
jgi:uncharacterized protein YfdQ (DUF2303 family)